MKRSLVIVAGLCLGFVAFLLLGVLPFWIAGRLLFGWWSYLARVLPQVTVAWDGVVTALVCLALFTAGLHGFLRWFHGEARRLAGITDPAARRWPLRRTVAIVTIVVVMFVAGIAATGVAHQVGWLLTAKQPLVALQPGPKFAGSSVDSTWSLRYIGLAASQFASSHDHFPATKYDAQGRPLQSWQTVILPYDWSVARTSGEIDYDQPWNSPRNSAYFRGFVPVYLNPEIGTMRSPDGYALSHYAGNVHVLGRKEPLRLSEVSNGLANTILAGEVAEGFKPWGDPTNLRDPMRGVGPAPGGFSSPAGGGANMLFLDCSVRFLRQTTALEVLRRMSLPEIGPPHSPSATVPDEKRSIPRVDL